MNTVTRLNDLLEPIPDLFVVEIWLWNEVNHLEQFLSIDFFILFDNFIGKSVPYLGEDLVGDLVSVQMSHELVVEFQIN